SVEHPRPVHPADVAGLEMLPDADHMGLEPKIVGGVPDGAGPGAALEETIGGPLIEDQRLLHEHVFAVAEGELQQLALDLVRHGQRRSVVASRRKISRHPEVGNWIEGIDTGDAAVSQNGLPLGSDVAESDDDVPHSNCARFSSTLIFSSISSGVTGTLP